MTLAIISHADCKLHFAGENHPEQPARIQVIQDALKEAFKHNTEFNIAPIVDKAALIATHGEAYVNAIFALAPQTSFVTIDEDTRMNEHTLRAAQLAAGAVILAVDKVMQQQVQCAFCNVRPPGHHAERERAMGFCFFNNVAVGATYAMNRYGLRRIAIIDFDVHHGNGTQDIFQHDDRVLYCSSFQHPFYPGYEPALDNDHLLSVPLPAGCDSETFRNLVSEAWFAPLLQFNPELIFFSAGFDAHQEDPLADINLLDEDYVWLTREIAAIAKKCCEGKLISVLEGGYNLQTLARVVPLHVRALIDT